MKKKSCVFGGIERRVEGDDLLDDREGLEVQEAGTGVHMSLFILKCHGTGERDILLAAKDFLDKRHSGSVLSVD